MNEHSHLSGTQENLLSRCISFFLWFFLKERVLNIISELSLIKINLHKYLIVKKNTYKLSTLKNKTLSFLINIAIKFCHIKIIKKWLFTAYRLCNGRSHDVYESWDLEVGDTKFFNKMRPSETKRQHFNGAQ